MTESDDYKTEPYDGAVRSDYNILADSEEDVPEEQETQKSEKSTKTAEKKEEAPKTVSSCCYLI